MTKRFVSEPIRPLGSPADAASLSRGEPGLPTGFSWRGEERRVVDVIERRKGLKEESFSGERYVHRHEYRLRMSDGTIWNVYFARQAGKSPRKKPHRWFLQTIEAGD